MTGPIPPEAVLANASLRIHELTRRLLVWDERQGAAAKQECIDALIEAAEAAKVAALALRDV